jgi:heat shock protein HtpX
MLKPVGCRRSVIMSSVTESIMPLTFIDIERQKSWRIGMFFLVLLFIYFVITALLTATFLRVPSYGVLHFWIVAGLIALLVAGVHFWFSAYDTVSTVIRGLSAQPPDPQDDVHRVLLNVMQEIQVVTGNKRKMQCHVIPSLSLNALAVADLKGEAAVAITEGLLSRLTRPQLETVLAHEAHHVLSGDCLETTVAASLFGTYASILEKLNTSPRGRSSLSPVFFLAWGMLQLSYLLNMFISREREYRADAASVRMTRNPIALAETLYLLSRSWRGAGFIGSGFEMLCIVNPQATALDETEGFWADLLSTHPPLRKRMDILLAMAHTSISELSAHLEKGAASSGRRPAEPHYFVLDPQQMWQGPLTIAELDAQPWLSPLTWITKGQQQPIDRAWREPRINAIFASRLSQQGNKSTNLSCPACKQPLVEVPYEGTHIFQCRFCSGTLVDTSKISRILARTGRERPCSDRINSLAKAVVAENQFTNARQKLGARSKNAVPNLPCPQCARPMFRGFYSQAYLIEIDRCSFCGFTWFDRNELEMLQCLIENKIVPNIADAAAVPPSV